MQEITVREAITLRHSVRKFKADAITETDTQKLNDFIAQVNEESGLHIQLVTGQKDAFNTLMNRYGWFKNVNNYVALVGKDNSELDELCGYYGEKIVLFAQQIGLSTCWVGGTFSRKKTDFDAAADEKLCLVIAIGYAEKDGKEHKSKALEKLANVNESSPEWFREGAIAAQLAPTAVNQQKFKLELQEDGKVKATGAGAFGKVDLGIAKYHFEVGSGKDHSIWA